MTCNEEDTPPGTQWDENNYSCAYDVLFNFFVTYRLQNQKKWNNIFQNSNQYLSTLHDGFQQCSHCNHTVLVNSNCTSRLMHVSFNMFGTISQILKKHMQHQSQEFCGTCNVPLNKNYISVKHIKYMLLM